MHAGRDAPGRPLPICRCRTRRTPGPALLDADAAGQAPEGRQRAAQRLGAQLGQRGRRQPSSHATASPSAARWRGRVSPAASERPGARRRLCLQRARAAGQPLARPRGDGQRSRRSRPAGRDRPCSPPPARRARKRQGRRVGRRVGRQRPAGAGPPPRRAAARGGRPPPRSRRPLSRSPAVSASVDGHAGEDQAHLHHVARRAGAGRDDRRLPPRQRVQQGGFAGIRCAEDRDRQPLTQPLAARRPRPAARPSRRRSAAAAARAWRRGRSGRSSSSNSMKASWRASSRVRRVGPAAHSAGQRALRLAQGLAPLGRGLGGDQVGDALGRGQVEPPVQEGAAGELAGLGGPRAERRPAPPPRRRSRPARHAGAAPPRPRRCSCAGPGNQSTSAWSSTSPPGCPQPPQAGLRGAGSRPASGPARGRRPARTAASRRRRRPAPEAGEDRVARPLTGRTPAGQAVFHVKRGRRSRLGRRHVLLGQHQPPRAPARDQVRLQDLVHIRRASSARYQMPSG